MLSLRDLFAHGDLARHRGISGTIFPVRRFDIAVARRRATAEGTDIAAIAEIQRASTLHQAAFHFAFVDVLNAVIDIEADGSFARGEIAAVASAIPFDPATTLTDASRCRTGRPVRGSSSCENRSPP